MRNLNISSDQKRAGFSDDYGYKCTLHVAAEGEVWVGMGEQPMMLLKDNARLLGAMLIVAANTGKITIEDHQFKAENPNIGHAIALMKRLDPLQLETMINIMKMVLIAQDKGNKHDHATSNPDC